MRPHGRARVNAQNPEAFAQCDRCGFWYNRSQLQWQFEWSGTHLYNTGKLVCQTICMDVPQEQLRTIILPPDPPPILNARPPNFAYEEAGPVQGVLAATALKGSNALVLQSRNGSLNDARDFNVGDVVWVQLVDAAYSANISFGQYQIINIDPGSNTLFIKDLLTAAGLIATAPINGTVTFSTRPIVPAPTAGQFVSVTLSGAGGAGEGHTPTVWFATVAFSGSGG
jgi:hypothetical protein